MAPGLPGTALPLWHALGEPGRGGRLWAFPAARHRASTGGTMTADLRTEAARCAEVLQRWYRADPYADRTGLYHHEEAAVSPARSLGLRAIGYLGRRPDTELWWNSANAITALIGYMSATGDKKYLDSVGYTFEHAPAAFTVNSRAVAVTAAAGGVALAGIGAAAGSAFSPAGIAVGVVAGALAGLLAGGLGAAASGAVGRVRYTGFMGTYYDDMAWWALAWIAAYDLTSDAAYLRCADRIFEEMTVGWDEVWQGGIYWQKNHKGPSAKFGDIYKNAIPNELLAAVGAALAVRSPSSPGGTTSHAQWAARAWEWLSTAPPHGMAMINDRGLINDSPNPQGVNDNTEAIWSYNQGVILGALCDLARLTGDGTYLARAEAIADAFIASPVHHSPGPPPPSSSGVIDGILHEFDDSDPTGAHPPARPVPLGTVQFKGIFVRNLATLYLRTRKEPYRQFILANAARAASVAAGGSYGANWAAPPDAADFIRQSSALDLLNAAVLVSEA